MIKFGTAQILSAELGGNREQRRTAARTVGITGTTAVILKQAHRAEFEYTPKPGFLYVRSRAISSRCNDNFDEFPADEIKQAYGSFMGKPVFVNHNNSNHHEARGVIIDAALHEDTNADGSPDVWTEVLMEVDAVKFPMLAKAILAGEVDRTSMGCDVSFSVCSACGNKASSPSEYCVHIPKLKGHQYIRYNAKLGRGEPEIIREICHGLSFFENSLLVEDPADPTALGGRALGDVGLDWLGKKSGHPAPGSPSPNGTDGSSRYSKLSSNSSERQSTGMPFTGREPAGARRIASVDEWGFIHEAADGHETYYHLTDNPKFKLDPDKVPEDNSITLNRILGPERKGLYVTKDPERWVNGHGYVRPYVAEIHAHPSHVQGGEYSGEGFISSEHLPKAKIHRVIPLDAHAREQFGDHGWIEEHHGTTFDTSEPIHEHKFGEPYSPAFKTPYHYSGPDVRDMPKAETDRHKERWLDYLKENRGHDDESIAHYREHTGVLQTYAGSGIKVTETTPEDFHRRFTEATKDSPYKGHVTSHDPDEIKAAGMKPLLANGGQAGVLIHHHGDGRVEATGLFRHPDAPKGVGMDLFRHVVQNHGVNYAEAFEPKLTDMYKGEGFETSEHIPFDPELADKNWNYKRFGKPPVAIMHKSASLAVDEWGGVRVVAGPVHDAWEYAKSLGRDYMGDEQVGFEAPQADMDNAYEVHGSHHPALGRILKGHRQGAKHDEAWEARWGHSDEPAPVPDFAVHGAHQYRAEHGLPEDHTDYGSIMADKDRHAAIAKAYSKMPARDPRARPAYEALAHEVGQQYDHMTKNLGVHVTYHDHDPYKDHHEMAKDVAENHHLGVLRTATTLGPGETPEHHPHFSDEQNDRFRAVHDFFGHAATGRGFDRHGEEAAWRHHASMFSPLARRAMTTETRGQNASLIANGRFPHQKMALLPERFSDDDALDSIRHASLTNEGSLRMTADSSIMSPDEIAAAAQPDAPPESGGGGKKPGGGGGLPGMPEMGGGGGEAAGGASALEELAPLALAAARMTKMEETHFKFHHSRKDPKGCVYCYRESQDSDKPEPKTGKLAYGETVAPPEVDTLREDICPVCGEHDSYNGDKCMVCGFVKPPSMFMDPDVEVAQNLDLRSDQQDENAAVPEGTGDLVCPNCGSEFASAEEDNVEGDPHMAPAAESDPSGVDANGVPVASPDPAMAGEEEVNDEEDEQPDFLKKPKGDDEEAEDGDDAQEQPEDPEQPDEDAEEEDQAPEQAGGKEEEALAEEEVADEAMAAGENEAQTGYSEGDTCPACGQGILEPAESVESPEDETNGDNEEEEAGENEEDDEQDDQSSVKKASSVLDPDFVNRILSSYR